MVIRTTRTHMTDNSERRERTDRSNIKLDLPGNLCRAESNSCGVFTIVDFLRDTHNAYLDLYAIYVL